MKKIFTILVISLLFLQGHSQLMQASIGVGSQPNRIKIYLKSDVTQSPSSLSTLQFNVGIDTTGLLVVPDLAVISSAFPSVTWTVEKHQNGGYWNFNIFTTTSPLTPNLTANSEFEAMELQFSNGTPGVADVGLVSLPDGGASPSYSLFYCTGTVNSNGLSQLYYTRSGVTVNNQNSYDAGGGSAGTATSTAIISSIVLPLKLSGFNAVKKDQDGYLTWTAQNQDAGSSHFEIERSLNGVDFIYVGKVYVNANSGSQAVYNYRDANVATLKSKGLIFYRIKTVDKDGEVLYSEVRNVKMNSRGFEVSLYPNPAETHTIASIHLEEAFPIIISISDAAGKQIKRIEIPGVKGANTKKLELAAFASGSYLLKVRSGEQSQTVPLVKRR